MISLLVLLNLELQIAANADSDVFCCLSKIDYPFLSKMVSLGPSTFDSVMLKADVNSLFNCLYKCTTHLGTFKIIQKLLFKKYCHFVFFFLNIGISATRVVSGLVLSLFYYSALSSVG